MRSGRFSGFDFLTILGGPVGLGGDHLEVITDRFWDVFIQQHPGIKDYLCQRVIDLVGHPGREFTDGCQALRFGEPDVSRFPFGDIFKEPAYAVNLSGSIAYGEASVCDPPLRATFHGDAEFYVKFSRGPR